MADVLDLKSYQDRIDGILFRRAAMLLAAMDSELLAEALRQLERLSQQKKLKSEARP